MIAVLYKGILLQEVPTEGHAKALRVVQPYFETRPRWFWRKLGWRMCASCRGRGRQTILSEEALRYEDGDRVYRWATWTSFSPPIQIETSRECPECRGLGRVRSRSQNQSP